MTPQTFVIDIDNTICCTTSTDYTQSEPWYDRIAVVNQLYDAGHTIVFFTARGSTTGKSWEAITKKQLQDWGVKHHQLIMNKPYADFYIDDRAINADDFFLPKEN